MKTITFRRFSVLLECLYKAYVKEYPSKIWPYMAQYLHFRILKFPLITQHIFITTRYHQAVVTWLSVPDPAINSHFFLPLSAPFLPRHGHGAMPNPERLFDVETLPAIVTINASFKWEKTSLEAISRNLQPAILVPYHTSHCCVNRMNNLMADSWFLWSGKSGYNPWQHPLPSGKLT